MDGTTVASDVAAFLTSFLPYLLKGGERPSRKSEESRQQSLGTCQGIMGQTAAKSGSKPAAQDAAQAPADEDVRATLRLRFKRLFTEDHALASEVARLLEEAKSGRVTVTAAGDRSAAIVGKVTSSAIV